MRWWPWSWFRDAANDVEIHTAPVTFAEPRTIAAEGVGGRFAVVTAAGNERVLTVAAGEHPRVLVKRVLAATTVAVGGYPPGTTTTVPRWRSYVF